MRGVALHRLDQVRDEVVPPLELDVDVRPAGLRLVPQADEVVVRERSRRGTAATTTAPTTIQTTTPVILGRVEAVVMAAGEGRRLRPLTERYAKPVLPIDGRPVIVTLLHELRAAGIERVTVVTGHLAEQVEALLDGFPFELRFVRAARAARLGGRGAARARRRSRRSWSRRGHRVHAGRHRALRRDAAATRSRAAATRRRRRRTATRSGSRTGGSRRCSTTTRRTRSPRRRSGGSARRSTRRCWTTSAGRRTSWREAFQSLIDAGETVHGVEIGPTRDLTHPLDLVEENFPYLRAL